jgi:anti-anti-sigma regulatory factor
LSGRGSFGTPAVQFLFTNETISEDIMTVATAGSFYVEQVRNVAGPSFTGLCFTVRSLDVLNYEPVSEELLEFVTLVSSNTPFHVVAELSSVRRIDDLGLAMLWAFHDSIADAGGRVVFCRANAPVLASIAEAGLRGEFEIRATRRDAMSAFQDQPGRCLAAR